MMKRFRLWLDALRTSLWFVPSLIVIGAVILAYAMLAADAALPPHWWEKPQWFNTFMNVRIRGASAMLQVIGSSIITIAGVVFSITIAAITLAAGQYTSRVLRNFIRDRGNQAVLGTFLGIFVYCMLVLRSLSADSPADQAPPLAMLGALALAFLGIAVLIYFIHHIVQGLQATNVVAAIARDAMPSIDHHFPQRFEPPDEGNVATNRPETSERSQLRAMRSGYITGIDYDLLARRAEKFGGLVRIDRSAGHFIARGEVMAELRSAEPLEKPTIDELHDAWSFAPQRTMANDPGYGLRQLVDVAIKALSPGINETTTCVMCLNWIGVMLLHMAERRFPPQLHSREGTIRVVTHALKLGDCIALAFDQIRQNAAGNVAILERQLEVLLALANSIGARVARQPILLQVDAIEALANQSIPWEPDRKPLFELVQKVREQLG
ncbi:DUF2254 domain-containing protein [Oleiagrimonas sp.]|jgi:uncharacterized membrane protein|uniref:DUF2254 domain-containing protein n=1 Tax=Oleiagrimonas sp. TaxID=2010330 RepID=UPI00262C1541|nr:DUF2254 domain-containing protein [Oleiagrimonas sp.]MDA3914657.1 DUF2254 domain-containing protein [Oleiagrimonas sp.]